MLQIADGADISELYEEHEIDRYLEEDADRLRSYLGEEPAKVLRAV